MGNCERPDVLSEIAERNAECGSGGHNGTIADRAYALTLALVRVQWRFIFIRSLAVACPYFMPTERIDDGAWIHPARLPLGGGWTGICTAPGHENETPSPEQVRDCCNLGYAQACTFRPPKPDCDSVRFGVAGDSADAVIVCYVCEKRHLPAEHGTLEYNKANGWSRVHPDRRIQKMAECYLAAYFLRKTVATATAAAS